MYLETTDRVFCFSCLRFDQGSRSSLANDSFSEWAHLSTALKSLESSICYMKFYQEWIEAKTKLKGGHTIDKLEQKLLIQKESER
jgi:hypothetical protein